MDNNYLLLFFPRLCDEASGEVLCIFDISNQDQDSQNGGVDLNLNGKIFKVRIERL